MLSKSGQMELQHTATVVAGVNSVSLQIIRQSSQSFAEDEEDS